MLIYKITNLVTSKVYIGQTIQKLENRWYGHKRCVASRPLYDDMRKYGISSFIIEKIEDCESTEHLNTKEIYWIKYYNSNNSNFGYNLTEGGESKINDESRRKISEYNKNRIVSDETRKKISKVRRGKKFTKEQLERLSLSLKGHVCSDETKIKIGNANRGSKNGMFGKHFTKTSEQIEKSRVAMIASEKFQLSRKSDEFKRKVSKHRGKGNWVVLDANFNLIKEFELRMDVVKYLGCSSVNVKKAREQNRILCKFFRVMYKSDFDKLNN